MDQFLVKARTSRKEVDVSLRGGITVVGRIKAFDAYSILLDLHGRESLIYKSAVSAIYRVGRKSHHRVVSDNP
jgi:RNA chaperone Hfq